MKKRTYENYIVLTPADGRELYNGEITAEYEVYLPLDADTTQWHERVKKEEDYEDR